jgi:ribosomal protein L11 methyltransferase
VYVLWNLGDPVAQPLPEIPPYQRTAMKPNFVQILITLDDAAIDLESAGEMLLSAGADSAETLDESRLRIICREEQVTNITSAAIALGFNPSAPSHIEASDWCPIAPELLEPLSVGNLIITPLLSADTVPTLDTGRIFLVPGTGFGTGHHATTASIIKLLTQLGEDEPSFSPPNQIADIGTGSGILAFAAAKLFPDATVVATDIDPLALDNALGNRNLNSLGSRVSFLLGDVPPRKGYGFDLILANIYGEVLVSLADRIKEIASKNSFLITSGIALPVEAAVTEAYQAWTLLRRIEQDNWVTLLFRR